MSYGVENNGQDVPPQFGAATFNNYTGLVALPATNLDGVPETVMLAISDIGLVKRRTGQVGCIVDAVIDDEELDG